MVGTCGCGVVVIVWWFGDGGWVVVGGGVNNVAVCGEKAKKRWWHCVGWGGEIWDYMLLLLKYVYNGARWMGGLVGF